MNSNKTLAPTLIFILFSLYGLHTSAQTYKKPAFPDRRIIIIMFDGFGMSYYTKTPMPHLQSMVQTGFFKQVRSLMPTVTNANNASICTGTFPETNGITGNSFVNGDGQEEYMEDKQLLLAPTIFQTLGTAGIKSALISSKKKTTLLMPAGADIVLSPETADTSWTNKLGMPPDIYSPEVNYWSMQAALYILQNRKDIGCLYIHTTDYPMHMWAPTDSNSLKHLSSMDEYIERIRVTAPDAMILITADHDVNHKTRCVDIEKSLQLRSIPVKTAISAEKDKYVKHHRGFGGASYVYLQKPSDSVKVKNALKQIPGVETVLSRREAAMKYHLMPSRIGDFVVMGDSLTVFGNLDNATSENLPDTYRSHGSAYELKVPLIIYNAAKTPPSSYFQYNKDLASWLLRSKQ